MNENGLPAIHDQWIISRRGDRNNVDPEKPYAWMVEKERTVSGSIEETAIIFLTNSECPFHCLMCDLWKNTTEQPVAQGTIPKQIAFALAQMPSASHLKLYNSGSFFDSKAIPVTDYECIASIVSHFKTVIVESHPRLINDKCLRFRDMLKPQLQVAMGLETVHPEVLRKLNKRMTLDDFRKSATYLTNHQILSRAFILLKPPFMNESEGIHWAKRSIDFAFDAGIECCTVIPVRSGNGAMEYLEANDQFTPPAIRSLEMVLEYGLALNRGRVFADTWDLGLFSTCDKCLEKRIKRIAEMNLNQKTTESISCSCNNFTVVA